MDYKNIKRTAVNTPFFTDHKAEIQIHQPWAKTLPSDLRSTTVRVATVWILVASWISFIVWIYTYIQALIIYIYITRTTLVPSVILSLISALHENGNER